MSFNFKVFYAFILGALLHSTTLIPSPAWLPLFIQKLWSAQEWKATCQSLENNDEYQQLKTKLGSSIEKLVLPTSVAQYLLESNKLYISDEVFNSLDQMKMQIKLNNFLTKENFQHFEPAQDYYLSEIDGELKFIRSREGNISKCFSVKKDGERPTYLTPDETDELLRFIAQTGYAYRNNMAEDITTHRLHNWWQLSSEDFKYTNPLEALGEFARKMDPNYGSRSHYDGRTGSYYEKRSILNKEGMDKLKERIFELTKKCTHENKNPEREFFKECYITPLSEVELSE